MFINKARPLARKAPSIFGANPQQIVEINGVIFVSNLYWLLLSSSTNYMAEARKEGDRAGCDVVAIRRGRRIQAGFVTRNTGGVKGMYSLAASLAALLGDSWCCGLKLNDGRYVVVVVHDGQIAPGFDLITDADAARTKLREAIGLFKFAPDAIFASRELQLSPHTKDIYELLKPKALRKDLRLKRLRFGMTQREIAVSAAGVGVLVAIGFGVHLYQAYKRDAWAQAAAKEQAETAARLARINADARTKLMAEALAHPWAVQPTSEDFIRICSAASDSLPLSIAGWILDSWKCNATELTATYRRVTGLTDDQFAEGVRQVVGVQANFDGPGDFGSFDVPHSMPAGGDDSLASADVMQSGFLSHFQALNLEGLRPSVNEKAVQLAFPIKPGGPPPDPSLKPPQATWRQFPFILRGSVLPPDRLFENFSHYAGTRIDAISATLNPGKAELTWQIEGNLYAQR